MKLRAVAIFKSFIYSNVNVSKASKFRTVFFFAHFFVRAYSRPWSWCAPKWHICLVNEPKNNEIVNLLSNEKRQLTVAINITSLGENSKQRFTAKHFTVDQEYTCYDGMKCLINKSNVV